MLRDARRTTKAWNDFLDDFVDDPELTARLKAKHCGKQSDGYSQRHAAAVELAERIEA